MSWFEEQITLRKRSDQEAFEDSCLQIAGSVMGQKLTTALNDEREQTTDAIGQILNYYRVKKREIPDSIQTIDDVLDYLLRPSGIMTREVTLRDGWRKDAAGAMLTTFEKDSGAVALIPDRLKGYRYLDPDTGHMEKVTKEAEKLFSKQAVAFYKPFPNEKLGVRELYHYILDNVDRIALTRYLVFALAATLVGMLLPYLSRSLFSDVIPSGSRSALIAAAVFMVCASLGKVLFGTVQVLFLKRISLGLNYKVQSAVMMRLLTLPSSFFKDYSSGDLGNRAMYLTLLVEQLVDLGFAGFATALFSIIYIFQIFTFTPSLAGPALITTVIVLAVEIVTVILKSEINTRQMELASREKGLSYAFISGIEKIRLSGAEKRAFARWGKSYAKQAELLYNPPLFVKASNAIARSIPLIGTVVLYYAAIRSHVSVAEYYAFNTAYGMVTGALTALTLIVEPMSQVRPIMEMVSPITQTLPETSESKAVIEKLSGAVELNNVTFRYREDMPPVLDNISLKIRPGQYVAITGKTGCGKSTLMRVMLGFETPQKGAVYYDGKDMNSIDLKSLRSKIGTVMQNSQLFTGDIYSNIVISAPQLTLDDAWEAARMAGLKEDIEAMPMNMFTMVSEGSGGISGGQRQRIFIARAIAPKPKILMFDEATSALDNITQKQVSDSLDGLKCTRIVIAHRLSTIRHCDRIIVLDGGKIVEDGDYDTLMEKNGYFFELVKRQQVKMKEAK